MDYRQALFIRKVQDLRERAESNDWYLLLGTAALLRHLLFDEETLTAQANLAGTKYRFFACVEPDPVPMPRLWAPVDGIDPQTAGKHLAPTSLNVDEFKALTVMVVGATRYSVKSLVRLASHVDGAVHTGQPEDAQEQVLKDWNEWIRLGGQPISSVRLLKPVARIAARGLEPLAEAIRAGG